MSALRALASQTAVYGLSTMVGRMLNYLLVPLYTRLFVPAEYGVVTDLYALVAFLNVVYTYGMETAYFRKVQQGGVGVYATAFWSLTASSVLFSGLLLLGAPVLAGLLQYPEHPEYVRWFALILAFDTLATLPFARLRQEQKALRYAGIRLFNIGLNVGLNLFFLIACPWLLQKGIATEVLSSIYQPELGVGYIFLSNLLANALTLLWLLPLFPTWKGFDTALWKEMGWYGIPLLFAGLAGMVNETLDRALLKYLLPGTTEARFYALGIYGAVYKLAMLMALFTQTFRMAAEPFFFQQSGRADARQTYARVMQYFVLAAGAIGLGVLLFLDVVKYFIDPAYFEGLYIVPILLLANLFLGVYYNQSVWYKLADKTRWGMYLSLLGAAITVLANYWLIPSLGYAGSAWATLLCYAGMMVASYVLGQRHYAVPYRLGRMGLYLLSAITLWQLAEILVPAPTSWLHWLVRLLLFFAYLLLGFFLEKPAKSVTSSPSEKNR